MVKVRCITNLDEVMRYETFPTKLPSRPIVGDIIESATWHNSLTKVVLEVVQVTWVKDNDKWIAEVELHLPKSWLNIEQFQKWYKQIRSPSNSVIG